MSDKLSRDTKDAIEMMGLPIIQFEPPGRSLVRNKKGALQVVETEGWIKFGIAFRNELSRMEGSSLAVFMCVCLHVNSKRESWPSLDTICIETGKARATVVAAIKHLKSMGILDVTRDRKHRSNTYRPMYAAYGNSSIIELPTVQLLNSNSSIIEPEVEPGRRTKKTLAPQPHGRARTPDEIERKALQDYFSTLTGIPLIEPNSPKQIKSIAQGWYQPIRQIKSTCNGSSRKIMEIAVQRMRLAGLTISCPRSIVSVCLSVYGESQSAAPSQFKDI